MMTVNDAALHLSVSCRFIYRLCSKGLLEHFKLGNRIRITQEAIERYLETKLKRTRQPKAEASPKLSSPQLSVLKKRR